MSYIVPREMPKNCLICPCFQYNMFDDDIDGYCKTLKVKITDSDKRHPNCPLVEIPPHGRLIDVDKFKSDYSMKNDCAECEKELQGLSRACEYDRIYSKMDFCQWIDNAETVIKAEGGTE